MPAVEDKSPFLHPVLLSNGSQTYSGIYEDDLAPDEITNSPQLTTVELG